MPKNTFDVTYDVVTPQSAQDGEVAERGFIDKGLSLRDAIKELHRTRTNLVDGVHAIECDVSRGNRYRLVNVVNGVEFETGAQETRYLHIPINATNASARRIARLARGRFR